jgi:nicotinic acid mononucleotide adenylyltransferase
MEQKGKQTMTREDLLTTYHQYKKNYLEVMGWDMKETFEEWLQRMEDIDSFLIQDNL